MKNSLKEANTASAVSTQNSPSLTLTLANSTVAFFTLTFYLIATTVYVLLYDSTVFIKYHFLHFCRVFLIIITMATQHSIF